MKLEFKFGRKETSKVKHLTMWFDVLFPNATITENLSPDDKTSILTLYDPNISEDGNSYYDDNIAVDTLLDGYPSVPSMNNWYYRMDSRVIWGSFKDEISTSDTVSHSSFELENETDDDGNVIDNRNDEIQSILENVSAITRLPIDKYSSFTVIKCSSSDNVQLTSYDLKRIVASSLMNLEPSISNINTYNVDGYRTNDNREGLREVNTYVSPTLEITTTISPKIK